MLHGHSLTEPSTVYTTRLCRKFLFIKVKNRIFTHHRSRAPACRAPRHGSALSLLPFADLRCSPSRTHTHGQQRGPRALLQPMQNATSAVRGHRGRVVCASRRRAPLSCPLCPSRMPRLTSTPMLRHNAAPPSPRAPLQLCYFCCSVAAATWRRRCSRRSLRASALFRSKAGLQASLMPVSVCCAG